MWWDSNKSKIKAELDSAATSLLAGADALRKIALIDPEALSAHVADLCAIKKSLNDTVLLIKRSQDKKLATDTVRPAASALN